MKRFLIFAIIVGAVIYSANWLRTKVKLKPLGSPVVFQIVSSAFPNNGLIPSKYTCDGEGVNPPLYFSGVQSEAKTLALIIEDPDAPSGNYAHWVVYNMPTSTTGIEENSAPNGDVALNSAHIRGYAPICPVVGTGEHTYYFTLYALDTQLTSVSDVYQLQATMKGHILDQAKFYGHYAKN